MRYQLVLSCTAACGFVNPAEASFVSLSATTSTYSDIVGTWAIIDVFAVADSPFDNLVAVEGAHLYNSTGALWYNAGVPTFIPASFQQNSFDGGLAVGWVSDSFVSLGTDQTAPIPSAFLGPGFNGALPLVTGIIGPGADWINPDPSQGQGIAGDDLKVLIGRFSIVGIPNVPTSLVIETLTLVDSTGGNAIVSGEFAYVPAPPALAVLIALGLVPGRRRRHEPSGAAGGRGGSGRALSAELEARS